MQIAQILSNYKILCLVLVFSFLSGLKYQSPWLEDWDSVQFSLGLHNYSVADHQPHPPGYPLYILMGKFFYPFFNNDTATLNFMSVLFGTLSILLLYLLTKKMFNKNTAVIAVIIFFITPIRWILSEVPISNITGLFFLICLGYLIFILEKHYQLWPLLGFIAGFILGVRLTDLPIVLGLLALLILRNFSVKNFLTLSFFFLLGISIWLVPLILISGLNNLSGSSTTIAQWFSNHESGIISTFGLKYYLKSKFLNLTDHLHVSYTPYLLILALASALLKVKQKFWTEFKYQLIFIWILSYLIPLFTIYNLDLPQYTLPLSVPLSIMTADFIYLGFQRTKILTIILTVLISVSAIQYGLDQVIRQAKAVPPTIAPVLFIKSNFNPWETTLITTFTYRQFQYYAPEFQNYYGVENVPPEITAKYIIVDYKNLKDDIRALKNYKIASFYNFSQPSLYIPRIHKTNIYVLIRN